MILGIDTSNYTTSVALVNQNNEIMADERILLSVKEGERGLRQSDALFQHIKNLPVLMERLGTVKEQIDAVAVSSRPRPVEGSYMPCFLAGQSMGRELATVLGVPYFEFSHQEGHIAAVAQDVFLKDADLLSCHLSGGTCEILHVNHGSIGIIGGSLDISFGQILDRTGVRLGYEFPCGRKLDEIAMNSSKVQNVLSGVKLLDGRFNLSGMETQIMRIIDTADISQEELVREIFIRICQCLAKAVTQCAEKSGTTRVILAGGVSSSRFIRENIGKYLKGMDITFGSSRLSSDNAVGTAILGGRRLWHQSL